MKNQLRTLALLGALTAMLVAVGGLLGSGYMPLFLILALVLNVGAYFFSDRIVLAMHRGREVTADQAPALHRIVGDLAVRAGIPKPRIFILPESQPNAFATGRNPSRGVVAVTEGIMQILSERELRGVLAHELAHIKNRDILVASIAAVIASAITYAAQAGQFAALFGGGRDDEESDLGGAASGMLLFFLAPIAATLVQLGISRSREYLADARGAELTGDPEALASALETLHRGAMAIPSSAAPATASLHIVNPLTGGSRLLSLLSTHPPMEERVARLRAMAMGRGGFAGKGLVR